MSPAQADLIEAVRTRFGPKAAITERDDIAPWETDWRGRFHGHAPAILAPADTPETQVIVALAQAAGIPLVPQGGNTSMVGGATPPPDGSALILSTRRLNRIRRLDPGAGLAIAEAGVILSDLHAAAAASDRRFPLSLGAKGSATIGGLVSTNAGGTQVLRWGTMRGLVAGVEAVLPDGSLHEGLSALKKDNRGYDLTQLMVGAEGTLGLVTAATLRLVPAVRVRAVAWAGVASPQAGLSLLRQLLATTEAIESFEIMSGESVARAIAHLPDAHAPLAGTFPWHLLIEVAAGRADEAPPAMVLERELGAALEAGLIGDAVIAASEGQADAFWNLRESVPAAERAAGPAVQHDISVPVAAMPNFMIAAAAAVRDRFPGTGTTAFGHLGDGNVHFHVRAPAHCSKSEWEALSKRATAFVHDLVVEAGGSISAEHGIGQMKLDEYRRLTAPARLAAQGAIKTALDPAGLFNPGKLIAVGKAETDALTR